MVKYEQWPPRPIGGQQVGTGSAGIRGVHYIGEFPSGIEACCEHQRSQHKNKAIVEQMIEWACAMEKIPL